MLSLNRGYHQIVFVVVSHAFIIIHILFCKSEPNQSQVKRRQVQEALVIGNRVEGARRVFQTMDIYKLLPSLQCQGIHSCWHEKSSRHDRTQQRQAREYQCKECKDVIATIIVKAFIQPSHPCTKADKHPQKAT